MEDHLSVSLRELRNTTDTLNSLTDQANDLVRRTEHFLSKECRVGGPVHVHVEAMDKHHESNDGAHFADWATYLGYERYNGELRIVVSHVLDGEPHETKAWAECPRDIKLTTLEELPELIDKLLEKVKTQVASIAERVNSLENVIPLDVQTTNESSKDRG